MENYQPPERFKIGITPEEFDKYRFVKDDVGDAIAASIHSFSRSWAEHNQPEEDRYDSTVRGAKREAKVGERAYHFFDIVEHALNNPHPVGADTRYRYGWNEKAIKLADEIKSDAIDKLDAYFDDTREMEKDPFVFLFEPHVQEALDKGAKIFSLYGTNVIFILAVRSLLKQYAAFNASNVLVSTKFLTRFPHRRIFETVQFLIDVVTPGNLKKDGKGIIAIKKLRLVHALVRHRITVKDPNINKKFVTWNAEEWGEPINQQDMIFAIHTFSIEIIRGLQKVGYFLDLTESERTNNDEDDIDANQPQFTKRNGTIKQDYYLAWHYIGKALGVKDEINPYSYDAGWELQQYIYWKEFRMGDYHEDDKAKYPNLTSPVLAEPLVNFILKILPFTDRRKDALALIAFYNDEEDYDPIFRDILGLDIKQIASSTYKDFLDGSLRMFDRFMEIVYKFSPEYGVGKRVHMMRVNSFNRAILYKLRQMSKSWSGHSFTLRDGLDNQEGLRHQIQRGGQGIASYFLYLAGFVMLPIFVVVFGPLALLLRNWIARYGRNYNRTNYNNEEHFAENIKEWWDDHMDQIADGQIIVDERIIDEYDLEIEQQVKKGKQKPEPKKGKKDKEEDKEKGDSDDDKNPDT